MEAFSVEFGHFSECVRVLRCSEYMDWIIAGICWILLYYNGISGSITIAISSLRGLDEIHKHGVRHIGDNLISSTFCFINGNCDISDLFSIKGFIPKGNDNQVVFL